MSNHRRRTLRSSMDSFDIGSQRIICLKSVANEHAVSADDSKHVTKVMRDAAGETSDGVHFVCGIQFFLQPVSLGYITGDSLNADGVAILVDQSLPVFQRNPLTVF